MFILYQVCFRYCVKNLGKSANIIIPSCYVSSHSSSSQDTDSVLDLFNSKDLCTFRIISTLSTLHISIFYRSNNSWENVEH
jgi:hypothetical protein